LKFGKILKPTAIAKYLEENSQNCLEFRSENNKVNQASSSKTV